MGALSTDHNGAPRADVSMGPTAHQYVHDYR